MPINYDDYKAGDQILVKKILTSPIFIAFVVLVFASILGYYITGDFYPGGYFDKEFRKNVSGEN